MAINKTPFPKVVSISEQKLLQPCSLEGLDYQFDPYCGCSHFCKYCYALNRYPFNWEEEIRIYSSMETKLRDELSKLPPSTIYIGMNSDPYQPLEKKQRQTRIVLEFLQELGFSACILTKSDLVIRDLDLLAEMPSSSAGVSFAFSNEDERTLFEKNAPSNKDRIRALEEIRAAGVPNYVLLCPIMPYITHVNEVIKMASHCTDIFYAYRLKMQSIADCNWKLVNAILNKFYPNLAAQFHEAAFNKVNPYWEIVRREIEEVRSTCNINLEIHFS
jgi:DNA repair photolyase